MTRALQGLQYSRVQYRRTGFWANMWGQFGGMRRQDLREALGWNKVEWSLSGLVAEDNWLRVISRVNLFPLPSVLHSVHREQVDTISAPNATQSTGLEIQGTGVARIIVG